MFSSLFVKSHFICFEYKLAIFVLHYKNIDELERVVVYSKVKKSLYFVHKHEKGKLMSLQSSLKIFYDGSNLFIRIIYKRYKQFEVQIIMFKCFCNENSN